MNTRKWPLAVVLSVSALLIVACGDNKDPRINDEDAICMKMRRMDPNAKCAGQVGGSTNSTTTTTTTQTQTQTATVTINQTNS